MKPRPCKPIQTIFDIENQAELHFERSYCPEDYMDCIWVSDCWKAFICWKCGWEGTNFVGGEYSKFLVGN